jgi:methionyl aminopeptidase
MIHLRRPDEIEIMRECGRIAAQTLELVGQSVAPGRTTRELERVVEEHLRERGAEAAFKGYRGYPSSICVSVNDEVVHGIPGDRRLEDGDLVSVDIGVLWRGYYADTAATFGAGELSPSAFRLLRVTRDALWAGIAAARPTHRVSDISHAVQELVESAGFSVVRALVGHGVGTSMHEDPQVPNFGPPGVGPRLKAGMVLAIEPMVNGGSSDVEVDDDGWTVRTKDGSLSAHFEHSVAVLDGEPHVLTEP